MKAVIYKSFGGVEQLTMEDVPIPQPLDNEVQIQILYTSVNPVDWKIREGYLKNMLPHEFPIIPGWDASGIVSGIGKNVTKFKEGDEVYTYCRKPSVHEGTYTEYICFNEQHVALKPKSLSFAQAAGIPLVGLTAWQSLFGFAKLKKEETILITAGAGGVGNMGIQFAKLVGAYIYTTASQRNHEYVKNLGADYPIDYNTQDFVSVIKEKHPEGIDVCFDCWGEKELDKSIKAIKTGGKIISIAGQMGKLERDIQFHFVFVAPNGKELEQIATLIDEGTIIPPVVTEMSLEQAAEAMEKNKEGHTKGKIVLKVNQPA